MYSSALQRSILSSPCYNNIVKMTWASEMRHWYEEQGPRIYVESEDLLSLYSVQRNSPFKMHLLKQFKEVSMKEMHVAEL